MPSSPTASSLSTPITVKAGETFSPEQDYTKYNRGSGACGGQTEGGDADAVFILEEGATLNRVVIGKDQSEGVHCTGRRRLLVCGSCMFLNSFRLVHFERRLV